ncbi:isochorismate synthase [Ancylothrix sp. C2]|uniref:isochorismate synthase n=1 Tax=Ancylothrix sp. D3o TaxID=2953691 RepID=UPI0021BAA3C2|nr:isochorismate synthase [Ancylothrix sp. D3o]MCT7948778.1 isochorismate synthase [Ancylothrix sp. D3o]
MLLIPHPSNLFPDTKALLQVLSAGLQKSIERNQPQIVSISLEIPTIDPLAVLQTINQPEKIHFYFEKNRSQNSFRPPASDPKIINPSDAIAAIDSAQSLTTEGTKRFTQAQKFIRTCLANTITTGNLNLPYSGPHFFCSFSFFDHNSPQDSSLNAATIFLPRWQISRHRECCVLVANLVIEPSINLEKLYNNFVATTQKIIQTPKIIQPSTTHSLNLTKQPVTEPETFKKSVKSALNSIHKNQYNKIVLASAIDVFSQTPFQIIQSLNKLRKLHPDCYIFSTGNGKGKTFIGASPERLVSVDNHILATDALAGSAPRGKTPLEDANLAKTLLNNDKEKHEHQVVIDFIIQRLSNLGLIPLLSPPIRLLQLSNIQHLWTPIKAQVTPNVSLLDIVAELHPTPAVAGNPRKIACQEIRQYENFNRCLYAGPLGWIDRNGNGEFIVGIRSAIIDGKHARLYAGAGIVEGSIPDKEHAEIQLKLQALLKALI